MRGFKKIVFTLIIALIGTMLPLDTQGAIFGVEVCSTTSHDSTTERDRDERYIEASQMSMLSTTTSTVVMPTLTPMVRTLTRTTLSTERMFQYSKAVSAIDSTTAASRYGLYNHKILFETLSRLYYLNRLMRLII